MYRLKLHKQVKKFLLAQPVKVRQHFIEKLDLLQSNPYYHPHLDIKIMRGFESVYRLRVGGYRFVYEIHDDELLVYVVSAGSRGDVYK